MQQIKNTLVAAMLAAMLAGGAASAEEAAKPANQVRAEIGKPIQSALDLIKAKKGREALAKIKEADAVKDQSPYENYMIERVRAQALVAAGDLAGAAQALEAAAALGGAPAAEKPVLLSAAASQYYAAKDYAKAVAVAQRYLAGGSDDASVRAVLLQSLYLSGDYAATLKLLNTEIDAAERAGKPSETQLQMQAQCYHKLNDMAGYGRALERLVQHYPSKDYWNALIYNVRQRPGLNDRLALDLARLQLATDTLASSAEFELAAQLALQQGFPAEAKRFIDSGYEMKLLGQGAEADRHRRLREMADKNLAEDKKNLGSDDAKASAAKDGGLSLNSGLNYVLHGQAEKGLAMMEAGLKKGGLKRPEDAKLRLGYAYYLAGNKSLASQHFKSVSDKDLAASLAKLWVIQLAR